jgi:Holliday junction resolvase RusA-like endonuclease
MAAGGHDGSTALTPPARSLAFTVYGLAQPAGSKRAFIVGGRAHVTDANRKSRPWKEQVALAAGQAMQARALLNGPVEVRFTFYRPRPAGHFGKRGLKPSSPAFPATKPDLLKLARGVEDAMTGVIYRDDAQIVTEHLAKVFGEPARIEITVSEAQIALDTAPAGGEDGERGFDFPR